jgi:hypothetical protein
MDKMADGNWHYHFGGRPDYARTGLSVVQYIIALFFAKWVIE